MRTKHEDGESSSPHRRRKHVSDSETAKGLPLPVGHEEAFERMAVKNPGGVFVRFEMFSLDRQNHTDVTFGLSTNDLADPDSLRRTFFEPAIIHLVDRLKSGSFPYNGNIELNDIQEIQ
jgi:hypothetical protein